MSEWTVIAIPSVLLGGYLLSEQEWFRSLFRRYTEGVEWVLTFGGRWNWLRGRG